MRRNRKLFEGLFDEFEDVFTVEDEMESLDNIVKYQNRVTSLLDCKDIEDINTYLIEKMDLINLIMQICNIVYQNGLNTMIEDKLKPFIDEGKIGNIRCYGNCSSSYWARTEKTELRITVYLFNDEGIYLYFKEKVDNIPGLTYRNKPVTASYIYLTNRDENIKINIGYTIYNRVAKMTSRYGHEQMRYSRSQGKMVPIETGDHPKLQQMKKEYNARLWQDIHIDIENYLQDQFNNVLHTDKIFAELEAPGKVYKVVQKDYDRMEKIFSDSTWNQIKYKQILAGFDKITNPNKLLARIVAYFIAAKNYKAKAQIFKITEDILLTYFFCDKNWRTRDAYDLTKQMILKIKDFHELHLKYRI